MNQEFFNKGYLLEKNLIPQFILDEIKDWWLASNVLFDESAQRDRFVENSFQVEDFRYNRLIDYIYDYLTPRIECVLAIPLTPTYNQGRIYLANANMRSHKDRIVCDVSVTLTVCHSGESWPIKLIDKQGVEKQIHTVPGDVLIYSGSEIEHWRDTNTFNDFQLQHFFHWYSPYTRQGSFLNEFSEKERSNENRAWGGSLDKIYDAEGKLPLPRKQNV